jgi:DNA-binding Lrp family transcriptional regulator
MLPNAEEEKILKEYKGDVEELAKPDKYLFKVKFDIITFYEVASVPRFQERAKFIEFISKFPSGISVIKDVNKYLHAKLF